MALSIATLLDLGADAESQTPQVHLLHKGSRRRMEIGLGARDVLPGIVRRSFPDFLRHVL